MLRSNPVNPYPRLEKEARVLNKVHTVSVFCWDRSKNYKLSKDTLLDMEIPIFRTGIRSEYGDGLKNLLPLIRFQFRLCYFLIKNRKSFDAIHAYDFDTGFLSLFFAKLMKKKLVYDIADFYCDSHNFSGIAYSLLRKLEILVINHSDGTIICNEARINQISGSKAKNLTIIHNSPNLQNEHLLGNLPSNHSGKLKIVYIGILAENRLIEEILEVVSSSKDIELHIGGFGSLDRKIKEESLKNNNIFYYGKVPYNDVLKIENSSDVVLAIYDPKIRNHSYAAPNKFYEGLALGKPVIMCKNTGMSDVIDKMHFGVLMEDFSKKSFRKAIDEIKCLISERMNISTEMKNYFEANFSWDKMEKRLIKLYEEI